jgi:hypothetical protein
MADKCEQGELSEQKSKDKLFHCLVAYRMSGGSQVLLRVMMVRAGREIECRDICYAKVMEATAVPPVMFRVKVIEASETSVWLD